MFGFLRTTTALRVWPRIDPSSLILTIFMRREVRVRQCVTIFHTEDNSFKIFHGHSFTSLDRLKLRLIICHFQSSFINILSLFIDARKKTFQISIFIRLIKSSIMTSLPKFYSELYYKSKKIFLNLKKHRRLPRRKSHYF